LAQGGAQFLIAVPLPVLLVGCLLNRIHTDPVDGGTVIPVGRFDQFLLLKPRDCLLNGSGAEPGVVGQAGRKAKPTAMILDSRTLQSTPESGARAGYDGAKRRKGSKVHAAVDTLGHLLALHVTAADQQDRAQVKRLAEEVQRITEEIQNSYLRAYSRWREVRLN
jgi:hypothetical protein